MDELTGVHLIENIKKKFNFWKLLGKKTPKFLFFKLKSKANFDVISCCSNFLLYFKTSVSLYSQQQKIIELLGIKFPDVYLVYSQNFVIGSDICERVFATTFLTLATKPLHRFSNNCLYLWDYYRDISKSE